MSCRYAATHVNRTAPQSQRALRCCGELAKVGRENAFEGVSMLVQFQSGVGGFTMFESVAVKLIRMTGHSGTVPGAIAAEEMEASLARLQSALAKVSDEQVPRGDDADADAEPPVSMTQRAFPLIDLMKRAIAEDSGLTWRAG